MARGSTQSGVDDSCARAFPRHSGVDLRLKHDPEKWEPVSRLREARFGGRRKVGEDHARTPAFTMNYRHAYHAGNFADVVKHAVLCRVLVYLREKPAAFRVIDTHAGAGLYRLDGDYAGTSGEAADGVLRLVSERPPAEPDPVPLADALARYLAVVRDFNPKGGARIYPGSPFIVQHLLRDHDKLKLFELHPTDARTLDANIAQLLGELRRNRESIAALV